MASTELETIAAVFIDRDGCINEDVGYVTCPEELVIYPWAAESIRLVNESGMKAIVITNQSGVARGIYTEEMLERIHDRLRDELGRGGAHLDGVYFCPHHPQIGNAHYRQQCICRKPQPGMLHRAAREHGLDLRRSFLIGDKSSDINAATNAGVTGVLVLTGYGSATNDDHERWPCQPEGVAANLLEGVKLVLDIAAGER